MQWILDWTIASKKQGCRFDPGPLCVEFACYPCAFMDSLWVLRLPSTVRKHACENSRLSLCVHAHVKTRNCHLIRGVTLPLPPDSWERLHQTLQVCSMQTLNSVVSANILLHSDGIYTVCLLYTGLTFIYVLFISGCIMVLIEAFIKTFSLNTISDVELKA